MTSPAFENGHFYSPVVNVVEASIDDQKIWPAVPVIEGVDFNESQHAELLTKWFPRLIDGYDYADVGPEDTDLDRFYENNTQFANLDPRVLFCMMRMIKPRRIVEVGSGYSTLVMMDVNARFLGNNVKIASVEPYPRAFLRKADKDGRIVLVEKRAQDVDWTLFEQLEDGDILFIDSSHVSKTGSDVNRLFLDILPRLAPGVYVHVHDIFFPFDYPKSWVIDEGRSWNEQYLLQAFLAFSAGFKVIFGVGIACRSFPSGVDVLLAGRPRSGGSFWIRRERRGVASASAGLRRLFALLQGHGHYRP